MKYLTSLNTMLKCNVFFLYNKCLSSEVSRLDNFINPKSSDFTAEYLLISAISIVIYLFKLVYSTIHQKTKFDYIVFAISTILMSFAILCNQIKLMLLILFVVILPYNFENFESYKGKKRVTVPMFFILITLFYLTIETNDFTSFSIVVFIIIIVFIIVNLDKQSKQYFIFTSKKTIFQDIKKQFCFKKVTQVFNLFIDQLEFIGQILFIIAKKCIIFFLFMAIYKFMIKYLVKKMHKAYPLLFLLLVLTVYLSNAFPFNSEEYYFLPSIFKNLYNLTKNLLQNGKYVWTPLYQSPLKNKQNMIAFIHLTLDNLIDISFTMFILIKILLVIKRNIHHHKNFKSHDIDNTRVIPNVLKL